MTWTPLKNKVGQSPIKGNIMKDLRKHLRNHPELKQKLEAAVLEVIQKFAKENGFSVSRDDLDKNYENVPLQEGCERAAWTALCTDPINGVK